MRVYNQLMSVIYFFVYIRDKVPSRFRICLKDPVTHFFHGFIS
jgi:hypothetical protein